MANVVRIKRRAAGGASGAPSSLQNAELAFNEQDNIFYYGWGTGGLGGSATAAMAIGGPGAFMTLSTTQTITGAKAFSGPVDLGAQGVATTPATNDNSTSVATTAYVKAQNYYTLAMIVALSLSSFAAPSADISWNSKKITNLADPTSAQDAATKAYVDARAAGLDPKESVKVVITTQQTLSGTPTCDGVPLLNGHRALLVGQTDPAENGIWVVNSVGWTRAADWATGLVNGGANTFVESGTTWGGTGWVLVWPSNSAPVIGTDGLTFTQFSGLGDITVDGVQLIKSGNALSVGVIAVANGGTGATSASTARSNLGLGSIATQAANAVAITGGSITNLTTFDGNTIDCGSY